MGKKVCGTGHRTSKFTWYDWNKSDFENELHPECLAIKKAIKEQLIMLINNGYDYFITGMALGFDTWLAESVIDLKKDYPFIQLEAAVPCLYQDTKWTEEQQKRYKNILNACDIIHYVSKAPYDKFCMNKRNYYMVDNSDMVIACYDGSAGGTRNAYLYAMNNHVNIININPKTKKIEYIDNR